MSERNRILAGLAAELAFAVLPLLVVLIVLADLEHSPALFASPEWSFGAAILFGQAVVKFVSGIARVGSAAIGPVGLALALIFVFGLAPSLLILTLTLQSREAGHDPARWLQISQVVLFSAAAIIYILLGAVGDLWNAKFPKNINA